MEPIYKATSVQGQTLLVYEDGVILTNRGKKTMEELSTDQRTIYYSEMTSIDFKNCGWFPGSLEFFVKGSKRRLESIISGSNSETKFSFGNASLPANRLLAKLMETIHVYIQLKINENAGQNQVAEESSFSAADEILKYKNLLDQGILTQEEFNKKKQELLNQ